MKKFIYSLLALSIIIGCESPKTGNMIVSGKIDGLKKGTIHLQKFIDTLLVSVDSIQLNGSNEFLLADDLTSPEVYFIALSNKPDEKISFFGEEGQITINTKLEKFSTSAEVIGSANQTLQQEYMEMIKKFNGKQLDLIKEKFEAQKENDDILLQKLQKDEENLIRRKYYFTTNFAVNNADHEIAPYLALTELYYANIKLLDTVNNSLTKTVKKSKYGLELQKFIDEIKKDKKK